MRAAEARAAEARASLLEAECAAAAAHAEAEAEREARLGAERQLESARAERDEEAAALLRATAAGGALQGRLEAAQAECAKLQAKLAELEAQKGGGGGGGLGGLNLAEMEMGALRGELEGWRLVAVEAQERQQRLELDLKASQVEIKVSCAPTRRLAPQPAAQLSAPCAPLTPPCPPHSPSARPLLAGSPSHACRRSLAPPLQRGKA